MTDDELNPILTPIRSYLKCPRGPKEQVVRQSLTWTAFVLTSTCQQATPENSAGIMTVRRER